MRVNKRKDLIGKLEAELDARVLVLVTGDRQGMETRIAPDILPLISEHLNGIGSTDRLALFLYTPGGDTIVGWGLVNVLRQYCKELIALVPFRALSCGTLISLGADKLIVGKHGLLSPVDPSVTSPFNPEINVGGQNQFLPVSVEDMMGFLALAKQAGLTSEQSVLEVFRILARKVHPLALGAVYRAREQSGDLAKRLLKKHMKDEDLANKIVKRLSEELPTHSYFIGRKEAAEIGIPVTDPTATVEAVMWSLYKEYEEWMHLTKPTSPEVDLGQDVQKNVKYDRAAVESLQDGKLCQHVYVSDVALVRVKSTPPGMQVPVDQVIQRVLYQGWLAATDGEAL